MNHGVPLQGSSSKSLERRDQASPCAASAGATARHASTTSRRGFMPFIRRFAWLSLLLPFLGIAKPADANPSSGSLSSRWQDVDARAREQLGRGDYAAALELLRPFIERADREAGATSEVALSARALVGEVLYKGGAAYRAPARRFIDDLIALTRSLRPPQPHRLADALRLSGNIYTADGDPRSGLVMYQAGYDTLEAASKPDQELLLRLKNNLVVAHKDLRHFDAADSLARELLTDRVKLFGEASEPVAKALTTIASIYEARGEFLSARLCYDRPLAIARQIGATKMMPGLVGNRANLLFKSGEFAAAAAAYSETIDLNSAAYGARHKEVSPWYWNLGTALERLDRDEEAYEAARTGLEIWLDSGGGDSWPTALAMEATAVPAMKVGKYAEAESLLLRALRIRTNVYGSESPELDLSMRCLSMLELYRGRFASALEWQQRCDTVLTRTLGGAQVDTQGARLLTARILFVQGRFAEAEGLLSSSIADYEIVRRRTGREVERNGFMSSPYPLLAASRLQLGALQPAWEAVEAAQGRYLDDLKYGSNVRNRVGPGQARVDSLGRELAQLAAQEQQLYSAAATRASPQFAVERAGFRARLDAVRAAIVAALAAERGLISPLALTTPSLAKVQLALHEDECLVGWLVDENAQSWAPRYAWGYCIRNRGEVQWVKLPWLRTRGANTPGTHPVDAFGLALAGVDSLREEEPILAARIYAARLGPILKLAGDVRELLVVQSGDMIGVPVEALVDGPDRPRLVDRYVISYLPSAMFLADVRNLPEDASARDRGGSAGVLGLRASLAVADPATLGPSPPRMPHGSTAASSQSAEFLDRALSSTTDLRALRPLPGARAEAVALTAASPPGSVLLVGEDASEIAVRQLADTGRLGSFGTILFATHAYADGHDPGRCALVLSQTHLPDAVEALRAGAEPVDGVLTASEVANEFRLDAELVNLSGCETALGQASPTDGFIGLPHAFLCAGARSVLATLGAVDDNATSILMGYFYDELRKDATIGPSPARGRGADPSSTKARALRNAKLRLRAWQDPAGVSLYDDPRFWAPFMLIGDPD